MANEMVDNPAQPNSWYHLQVRKQFLLFKCKKPVMFAQPKILGKTETPKVLQWVQTAGSNNLILEFKPPYQAHHSSTDKYRLTTSSMFVARPCHSHGCLPHTSYSYSWRKEIINVSLKAKSSKSTNDNDSCGKKKKTKPIQQKNPHNQKTTKQKTWELMLKLESNARTVLLWFQSCVTIS